MAVYYRILRQRQARRSDFLSDLSNALPMRPPQREDLLCWVGVSVFPALTEASERARAYKLGEWIGEMNIPDSDSGRYQVRQTTRNSGHYSIAADPALLVSYVRRVTPVSVPPGEPVPIRR